jgi:hypothetical protein
VRALLGQWLRVWENGEQKMGRKTLVLLDSLRPLGENGVNQEGRLVPEQQKIDSCLCQDACRRPYVDKSVLVGLNVWNIVFMWLGDGVNHFEF